MLTVMTPSIPHLAWLFHRPTAVEATLTLAPGATVALHPGRHARIVADGRVWITQSSDLRDHLPEPGQAVALDRRGLVVAQNLESHPICLRCRDLRRRG